MPDVQIVVARPVPALAEQDIQTVAAHLVELAKRDGRVTPESVLALAKDASHPLHRLFEWDEAEAARQHRLHQARQIVRTVLYRVRSSGEGPLAVLLSAVRSESRTRAALVEIRPSREAQVDALPAVVPPAGSPSKLTWAADTISQVVKALAGTMEVFDELRELRALGATLRRKAEWAGRRCPACSLVGHGPGAPECLRGTVYRSDGAGLPG